MKSVNLIKVNLHGLLNIRFVFLVLLVFTLYFFLSMDLVNHKIMNGFQILYNFYLGPHFLGIEFLKWLFHQTPIILLVCNYFDKQIHEGAQFYIPRVGNTRTWILNLLISFIFIIFLYYGLGFFINFLLITGFYGLFDNINMHIFKPQFDQYILICLSTICVVFFIHHSLFFSSSAK